MHRLTDQVESLSADKNKIILETTLFIALAITIITDQTNKMSDCEVINSFGSCPLN
jgi:hypothetical protein